MKQWFVAALILFFLAGCNGSKDNKVTADDIRIVREEIKNEISRLESEISEKDKMIKELQEDNSYVKEINSRLFKLELLVYRLPDLTPKQGYINEIVEDDTGIFFMIDYAKMVYDEDAPNNFHIENEKEEYVKVKANREVTAYVLDRYDLTLKYTYGEKFNNQLKEYTRLFNLYFVEGELILASEQYIP